MARNFGKLRLRYRGNNHVGIISSDLVGIASERYGWELTQERRVTILNPPFLCYIVSMAFPHTNDLIEIENRNRLRQEAGLPLLSVETEMRRLHAARDQAAFERQFERRRAEFCHQWIGNRDGWLTNMGRWSLARQRVCQEMQDRPG